ncbi:MAG TPA: hypothetical protein VJR29_05495 [bacterium]|nr:hypothetical protein [bacterium]
MTPIKPRLFSVAEENVCRMPEPIDFSELVCRQPESAATFTATLTRAPGSLHPRYENHILNRRSHSALASALSDTPHTSESRASYSSPFLSGGWGLIAGLASVTGCSSHDPLTETPTDTDVPDPSDGENPPMIPGEDGGLGAGIQTTFGTSVCPLPLDLDQANNASQAIMTCGHNGLNGTATGVGTAELIDIASGNVTPLQLPTTLDGDEARPVSTFSSATGTGGVMYTGFAAANTVPQLQGNNSLLSNSGVFVWNESSPGDATAVTFPRIAFASFLPDERFQLENEQTLTGIRPNRPVSMVRQGNYLFTLSDPFALDGDGSLTRAPAVVHRFTVGSNGALTPAPIPTASGNPLVVAGTDDPANATVLAGAFRPTAIAAVGSDRIAVLVQGSEGLTSTSSLRLYTNDMAPTAFEAAPNGDPVSNEITLPPGFVSNSSSQLTIVEINGQPHALVGSEDGSGRIAVVNLSSSFVPSEDRVHLINVFDEDHDLTSDHGDIANIVVRPDGQFAYAISTDGKIRAVALSGTPGDTDSGFGAVGNIYNLTGSAPADGVQQPALFSNGAIVSARPLAYSKAPIQ